MAEPLVPLEGVVSYAFIHSPHVSCDHRRWRTRLVEAYEYCFSLLGVASLVRVSCPQTGEKR